ncbi:MAG: hypothetical protein H0T89_27180 [Deltaproteobacteria bacterium]|nr:hypothetical protein [Deltaproteobacteria bacterium]MDQ3298329.1 hypothetical protein [Myxococcota bacterium]
MADDPPQLTPELTRMFDDLFGSFFGNGGGSGLEVPIAISDAEAAAGLTREVTITPHMACTDCEGSGNASPHERVKTCTACGGTGQRQQTVRFLQVSTPCPGCRGAVIRHPCATCAGAGHRAVPVTVTIVVPPGTEHGQRLDLGAVGAPGLDGKRGNVSAFVLVGGRPDPRLDGGFPDPEPAPLPVATLRPRGAAGIPTSTIAIGLVIAVLALVLLMR